MASPGQQLQSRGESSHTQLHEICRLAHHQSAQASTGPPDQQVPHALVGHCGGARWRRYDGSIYVAEWL